LVAAGGGPSVIGFPRFANVCGEKDLRMAISWSRSMSENIPSNAGIDVPVTPNRIAARRSSSVGGSPTAVDRHSYAPLVKSRGFPDENGAAGPRPSPALP
jgi:hypothetical protein